MYGPGIHSWHSVNLDHPAKFETLAMDDEMKRMILDDLDMFVKRKELYRKEGKAWKRGYLLLGPPGTGKSSIGDERIIIFTTNHKEKLEPALLRPGRMDVHIKMSYCTACGFRLLANNYLGVMEHPQVEELIGSSKITPAEVGEQLLKSEDPEVALHGFIKFLELRKEREREKCEEVEVDAGECKEGSSKLKTSKGSSDELREVMKMVKQSSSAAAEMDGRMRPPMH